MNDSSEEDSMVTPKRGGGPKVTRAIYDKLGVVREEDGGTPKKQMSPQAKARGKANNNQDLKHHYK